MPEDRKFTRIKHLSPFSGSPIFSQVYRSAEDFYDRIAQEIASNIRPKTVLDIGCGTGRLVAQLRSRDVQAFGIEFSEDARDHILPEVRTYCSITTPEKPFEEKYDLVICLETILSIDPDQALTLIQNICARSDEVLFSSNPLDIQEAASAQIKQMGEWAALFAEYGFVRKPGEGFSKILPWGMHLHRTDLTASQLVNNYEDQLWQQRFESLTRRDLGISLQKELSSSLQDQEMINDLLVEKAQLSQEKDELYQHYLALINSRSWRFMQVVHRVRHRLIPLGSRRERWMYSLMTNVLHPFEGRGLNYDITPIRDITDVTPHSESIDIIVCVHNALDDVKKCLESIVKHTTPPYTFILVDDGSDKDTQDYLQGFSNQHDCQLICNQKARGYTFAANQGLRASTGDFTLLLNSDTIVTPEWLDRMIACALSDRKNGIVGPLSNTASWQSIPEIETNGDWAENPLPPDLSVEDMAALLAQYSGRIYPPMQFLNGFCLLIRNKVIQNIGIFDEEHFGVGYGEEDDYCLRAKKAGWKLALADDVYIYHAQSRSYTSERRKSLYQQAGKTLAERHGQKLIDEGVHYSLTSPVLQGIRARSAQLPYRREFIGQGKEAFSGRRVLFVLPVANAGGGSNVVISEAHAMRSMGVDARIYNLEEYKESFESSNPRLDIPITYGQIKDIPELAAEYDAVIATFNTSVAWISPAKNYNSNLKIGYYVQGFEPLIYPEGSSAYQNALASYTLIKGMVLFCKTEWVRQQVLNFTDSRITNIGVSIDTELYRPRPPKFNQSSLQRIRIGAMVRPGSPYRAPALTMSVFKKAYETYGAKVQLITFGMNSGHVEFDQLNTDFKWESAGELTPLQVASYMNEIDIFADFSSHQAMGLSALEAMACGAAVILPVHGGASDFARHERNSLVIDTTFETTCWDALRNLIEDTGLRSRLQNKALEDVCQYYPEKSAFNILRTLFES